jgi:NADH-quinone oxidoreductase subunit A
MATPTAIAAYLLLFVAVGVAFVFVHLLLGRFVRPDDPHTEKKEIYECGEPTIGSSFVQFDLRFYVVALVFIVFDAEVAFLFPAATVFGKQTQLADARLSLVDPGDAASAVVTASGGSENFAKLNPAAEGLFQELGIAAPPITVGPASGDSSHGSAVLPQQLRNSIKQFTLYVYLAILFFFVVLLIGFAYEWKTGAFDWVRAVTRVRPIQASGGDPTDVFAEEPVTST